jgi:signal transduction histidine kinase
MKTFWSIKRKLLIFALCISLIPILVITILFYLSARGSVEKQINQKMIAVAESKALHIEAFLKTIRGRTIDFCSDGYIRDKLDIINQKVLLEQDAVVDLSSHLKNNKMPLDPDIASITVLNTTGTVVASTIKSIIGNDFSNHEEFVHIVSKNKKEVFTHRPHFQQYLNHSTMEVAAPVTSMESGQTIGIIINAYNQEIINDITSNREGMGNSGEIVIGLKEDGTIQFINTLKYTHGATTTLKIPLNDEAAEPMRLALEGKYGTIIGHDYRDINVIAAYRYIPSIGWGLVAKMDKAEAFGPLTVLRNIAIVLGGVSSIAVILVGISFSISTSRPINRLTAAAKKISNGNYDYSVEIDRHDEIGALAVSFNSMTSKLTHEINEQEKAEARLTGLNKELEAFCYSVSHDLRAPLRGIEGFSRALEEDYADKFDLQGKDYLRRICTASHKMDNLITDLLDLSRITRSKMKHEKVDLSALVKSKALELQETEPERQVEFVIAEGDCTDGDTKLLKIAIDNLMDNAWKFTGKHSQARIEFGISLQDGESVYFISDDGVGFDMTYADKLFGAFQRLHSITEFEGTGIGLATVNRIIQRHGGNIWAEGEIGQGAKFCFTL